MTHTITLTGSAATSLHGVVTPLQNISISLLHSSSSSSSHLSFKTHLRKQNPCLKKTRGHPIKAAAVSTYVDTEQQSFYDLLGISESGTLSEIKSAYKQLARKYHPDVSPPDRTEEYTKRFIRVHEAYETLSDPQTRAMYDRNLANGLYLAFNARDQFHQKEEVDRNGWRQRCESQLAGLHRKSMNRKNTTWGARMRSQRHEVL